MKPILNNEFGEEFSEKAGMINIYVCPSCRWSVLYRYEDNGITPAKIQCECCGQDAFSQLSDMHQPDKVWYRPKIEEIESLAAYAAHVLGEDYAGILVDYIKWYNEGGLFCKV